MSKKTVPAVHAKIVAANAKITKEQEALENAGSAAEKKKAKARLATAWKNLELVQDELAAEEKARDKEAAKLAAKEAKKGKNSTTPSPADDKENAPEGSADDSAKGKKGGKADTNFMSLRATVEMELEQRPDWKKLGVAGRKDAIYAEVQKRMADNKAANAGTEEGPKAKKGKKDKAEKPAKTPKEAGPKTRTRLPDTARIVFAKGAKNPHREGSNAYDWFESARECKTVKDFAEVTYDIGYLKGWQKRGLLQVIE